MLFATSKIDDAFKQINAFFITWLRSKNWFLNFEDFTLLAILAILLSSLQPYSIRDFEICTCRLHAFLILLRWICSWFLFNIKAMTWINFLLIKRKLINFDWTFYVTWINFFSFLIKNRMINFDWTNNLNLIFMWFYNLRVASCDFLRK